MSWVDLSQAAFTLGVSERTIRNWIKNGKLQARSNNGRREVEIPEPEDAGSSRVFADEESEPTGLNAQKRLEVALIECGRVKGTLASQERIMENLSSNITELQAKLQKSHSAIWQRTLLCVVIGFLGMSAWAITDRMSKQELAEKQHAHGTELLSLIETHHQEKKEDAKLHAEKLAQKEDTKNKERLKALTNQSEQLEKRHRKAFADYRGEVEKRIGRLDEQIEKLRTKLDEVKTAHTRAALELGQKKQELKLARGARIEAESQVQMLKLKVEELEKKLTRRSGGRRGR